MSDWSCRQREARSHLRLFHLVLGSHDGRALVPIPKRSAYPASDLDVVVVDSLKALDPNRPIREGGHLWEQATYPPYRYRAHSDYAQVSSNPSESTCDPGDFDDKSRYSCCSRTSLGGI